MRLAVLNLEDKSYSIYINPAAITKVEGAHPEGTKISFSGNDHVIVRQELDKCLEEINAAMNENE